jgi:hypothetical protein
LVVVVFGVAAAAAGGGLAFADSAATAGDTPATTNPIPATTRPKHRMAKNLEYEVATISLERDSTIR